MRHLFSPLGSQEGHCSNQYGLGTAENRATSSLGGRRAHVRISVNRTPCLSQAMTFLSHQRLIRRL